METQLVLTSVQQKKVWDNLARGREKWHDFMIAFLKPMGDEMVRVLQLKNEDTVLDLATGTGEPGLTIAGLVAQGKVVGADISQDMLRIAQTKALQKGVPNFETVICEAGELPFADNTFDAASCRNGYMFFPDLLGATRELYRVVKPGSRIAASVWGAPDMNGWVSTPMRVISSYAEVPGSLPENVSLFRCAQTRLIADLFRDAGFQKISETRVTGKICYPSKEAYWQFITEVTAPVALAISELDATTQIKIKNELLGFIQKMSIAGSIVFDYEALVVSGEK